MAGGGAVVNERVAFFRFQELGDVGRADFQFERRGDAVQRLDALALDLLAVLVKINESGSDHQSAGMKDAPSAQRIGRDAGNLAVADANVADSVQSGFWIHDASAFEHQIVLLCGAEGG